MQESSRGAARRGAFETHGFVDFMESLRGRGFDLKRVALREVLPGTSNGRIRLATKLGRRVQL